MQNGHGPGKLKFLFFGSKPGSDTLNLTASNSVCGRKFKCFAEDSDLHIFLGHVEFFDKKLPLTLFHLEARLCSPHYYSIFRTSDGPGNRQSLQIPETEIILLGDLLTNSGENCLFVSLNLNFNKIFSRILDSLLSTFYDLHFVCCLF